MPLKDKAAQSAYNKAWRLANRAKRAEQGRTWRANNPVKAGWTVLKSRAKRSRLDLNLTFDEYQTIRSQPCLYCADYFRQAIELGSGLDRIDNTQGYTPFNICPCCAFCNYVRGEQLSVAETKAAVLAVIRTREAEQ